MSIRVEGVVLIAVFLAMPIAASAITVEVAKKCNALTAKQFPLRVVGNPASGSAKGSAQDQRAFFGKCVANGGKVDDVGATKPN